MAAANVADSSAAGYFPIGELSNYHPKWVVRARVTSKGQTRSFNERNGKQTQVFDCSLLDESGEIRASFFGAMAEKFGGMIEQGRVYTFSRGGIRIANRRYNRCDHRYELVFDRDGLVEPVQDDGKIEAVKFNFADLRAVQSRTLPCSVDICGIVVGFRAPLSFTSKDGKELVKREITIADDTATSMSVALWGQRATQEDKVFEGNPLVCLKGVSVKEFKGGRSGSLENAGVMLFDSELPDAQRVRRWWAENGKNASLTSLSLSQEGIADLMTIQGKALPCTVDVCGIVVSFKPAFSFTSQGGKELVKRDVVVADYTGLSMQVTLWGDRAQQADASFDGQPTILLRGVLVKEWNGGRSGSLLEAGALEFSPRVPEADKVRLWWSQGGSVQGLTALSQEGGGGLSAAALASGRVTSLSDMRRAAELVASQPEVHSVVARLALVQTKKLGEPQPLLYMACQEPRVGSALLCNKRVGEDGYCPSCNRAGKVAPRLNIRCRFADHEDSAWLTTFHEAAQSVLGATAQEAKDMEGGAGREALEASIRRRYFSQPLQLTVRAKLDSYQGEVRPNITCIDARPLQRGAHGRLLLKGIREMLGQAGAALVA